MSKYEIKMPKMGESVQEATITKWFVKENDKVEEDDVLFEIATDKVDSEIPCPVDGTIVSVKYNEGDLVPVGEVVAIVALEGEEGDHAPADDTDEQPDSEATTISTNETDSGIDSDDSSYIGATRFYSPLVRSIAKKENISLDELEKIPGNGRDGRVQKADILNYIENRGKSASSAAKPIEEKSSRSVLKEEIVKVNPSIAAGDEIVEMDRMRKLIAEHMVASKRISPHVTSMVEADVTNLVLWRNKVKNQFVDKYGTKLSFMPMIIEASAKALRDFKGVNASVLNDDKIVYKKRINIGVATALDNGNLMVPVVKDADMMNLNGLASRMNDLVAGARSGKINPDDITGGTFTISNFGSFQNIMGTPIINQPEAAILAVGTIDKKPAVIETPTGDIVGIRHKMFLSLSYDHRIVDGALGGAFLRRIADYLENFDLNREI